MIRQLYTLRQYHCQWSCHVDLNSSQRRGRDRMAVGFTTICAISEYITVEVVSSNPVHCEVHWIQHYVIKLVSDLRQVVCFPLRVLCFPSPKKKTDRHDITEILLKVVLNTKILSLTKCTIRSRQWRLPQI